MSIQITQAFVDQFRSNVIHLAQQTTSRLWQFVQLKDAVKGKAAFFERIGRTEMRDVVTRHDDTPRMDTPHSRRKLTLVTSDWADLIDKADEIRVLIDPTSSYTKAAASAVGRRKDKHIINACVGNSYGGVDGNTSIALPAAQKIAAGGVGMTLDKLLNAKQIFDANEIGTDETGNEPGLSRVLCYSSQQIRELLGDTRLTNIQYNTVRALQAGEINEFLGFKFVRVEPRLAAPSAGTPAADDGSNKNSNVHGLPYNQATDVTTCIAFYGPAIGLGIGEMETFRVSERADKRYSMQVYCELDIGAIRVQEEGVVTIDCDNSP